MNKKFDLLPLDVQDEIKDLLKSYDKVHVIYEDKKYWFSLTTAVTDHYAFDTGRYIGTYYADDVFSPDERILNYVNSFHSYPVEYIGKIPKKYRNIQLFRTAWSIGSQCHVLVIPWINN